MPKNVLEMIRKDLGEYGYAGQFLQSPSPLGGGMFQTEKLTTVIAVPAQLRSVIRYWDKAGTVNAGCYTVGLKMGVLVDGRVIVLDIVRGRWGADEREKIMRNTALADGVDVKIFMEQEGGSGGKESAMYSIRNLAGFTVEADLPKGNKALRADPFASQMGAGNVMLLKAPWNFDYVQELSSYPNGRYLDQIDASSGAFNKLSFRKRAGVWGKGSI
jgi:predicted phage terminase large subunit-like protein